MKYEITHKCGHKEIVNLFGKHVNRENKIKWMEEQECIACKAKRVKEEKSDLPTLIGSDKQIVWAHSIRATLVRDIKSFMNTKSELPKEIKNMVNIWLTVKTKSHWWIENRDIKAADLLITIADEIKNIKEIKEFV